MRTAVITAVHGRGTHLRRQLRGLSRSTCRPDIHVIVAMSDPAAARIAIRNGERVHVVSLDATEGRLPVAAARNVGARTAIDYGAELLIFLDVDCIPGMEMIEHYHCAAVDSAHVDALLCGPVTYLDPPPPSGGYDLDALQTMVDPHPGRPVPDDGQILNSTDYALFWSLSFAVRTPTWNRIGGFCTDYIGYGGEDTDFGQLARQTKVPMRWVGGAHAFHQYHPVSNPPVEHLDDILRNSSIFHQRWGWWPMRDWLDEFVQRGLVRWDTAGGPRVHRGTHSG
jgi:GT2 family glycosyltransferase